MRCRWVRERPLQGQGLPRLYLRCMPYGQLNYKGAGIRIDGGPAGTDMDSFLQDLATAFWAVRIDQWQVRARFVKNVMDRGHYASENDVVDDLQKYSQRL